MRRDRPPLPAPLAALAEPLYAAAVARRNRAFDAGKRVTRLDTPVISIGNLSVGGTGKTPTVAWAARTLISAGRRPAIAMRGYKARPGQPSDEQLEYAATIPDVPVEAHADRVAAARRLVNDHNPDAILLDDGFQHRFLHRDIDVVLLDATRSPFDDRCLPAGWLREPVASLARAHAAVITHADLVPEPAVDAIERAARAENPRLVTARARHAWDGFEGLDQDPRGRPCLVVCAIGNPDAFIAQARAEGLHVLGAGLRRDHHHWSTADARAIAEQADALPPDAVILTTTKDWVKLERVTPPTGWPRPVLRPRLAIAFDDAEHALADLILRPLLR